MFIRNGLKIQWIRTTHTNSSKSLSFDLSFSNKDYFVFGQSERTDNSYPNTFVGGAYNKQNDNRTFYYATSYNSQSESVTNDIFFGIGY
ncbi:gp53-like domain-containing protein [Treponema bryantii]|uniref:gp53-like domain-containing protein n=1 Tax=Treponema bryantii TaxID=163 RepID=UPI003F74E580